MSDEPTLPLHRWDVDADEAKRIQRSLAGRIELSGTATGATRICGLDVAYEQGSDRLAAAAVLLDPVMLDVVEQATVVGSATFGYVPGLFSFREMPPLLDALSRLSGQPDLLVCDGQGYAHPARFGLACHLGLWTGIPTIGCAKKSLIGHHEPPSEERSGSSPLVDRGEVVGYALRTRARVKPVIVSPGHKIGFDAACEWILRLTPRFRLPETTRAADRLAAEALRAGHR